MKYFVTGATGFIGSYVAKQLLEAGHQVVTVVRNPEKAGTLTAQGAIIYKGDITDKASLLEPMRGVDGVFHIAGWYKVGVRGKAGAEGQAINVLGTRNILETMRDLNIAKGVYTSTLAVFSDTKGQLVDESYYHAGPWLSEYDRTKWEAHYNVALPMIKAGLPLVVVQPGLVYGPGDTSVVRQTLIQYLQRKLPMLPKKTAFAWAHVEDIARGHILAMEKGQVGESYIIAGPTHTLIEGMQIAEAITGIKGPRFYMPVSVMRGMAAMMGLLDKILPLPQTYTGEGLRSTAGVTYLGDNAKARRELGYQPRALQTGLRQTLEYEMQLLNIPSRLQRNQTTAS